ncbi:hypothetical protein AX17_005680 [Amanita inopinata Kibby_2008]|nr:hypothetical protein AX17_005680 [Amanita inopinata Kibby_2008]
MKLGVGGSDKMTVDSTGTITTTVVVDTARDVKFVVLETKEKEVTVVVGGGSERPLEKIWPRSGEKDDTYGVVESGKGRGKILVGSMDGALDIVLEEVGLPTLLDIDWDETTGRGSEKTELAAELVQDVKDNGNGGLVVLAVNVPVGEI